jgi:hypothetical protein
MTMLSIWRIPQLFVISGMAVRLSLERRTMSWMLAAIGFASVYLNESSGRLCYLSNGVYPVYI